MAKFFIRLGEFNKAMLLPFLLALAQLIRIILDDILKENKKNYILESSILGLGQVAIIIIPHIKFFSLSNKKEKTKCECSYKIILRYAILLFLFGIETNVMYVCYISRSDGNYKSKSMFRMKSEGLATKEGLEMVFITIISIFLLKYKYFIHHILSIIFFFISSAAFDFFTRNYTYKVFSIDIYSNLFLIGSFFAEGGYFCFIKYMIDKHYHHYWNIMLSIGIMVVTVNVVLIMIITIKKVNSLLPDFIDDFLVYFQSVPVGIIVSKFFINFILQFIACVLEILTIFYLSPEFLFISGNVAKIIIYLKEGNKYKYISIIFFLLQFFCLMIYLEILELNFLNLNINTKRNIKLRTNEDHEERYESLIGDVFEVEDGYIFKNEESGKDNINNSNVELRLFEASDKQEENLL
jgi:hypothetical protein